MKKIIKNYYFIFLFLVIATHLFFRTFNAPILNVNLDSGFWDAAINYAVNGVYVDSNVEIRSNPKIREFMKLGPVKVDEKIYLNEISKTKDTEKLNCRFCQTPLIFFLVGKIWKWQGYLSFSTVFYLQYIVSLGLLLLLSLSLRRLMSGGIEVVLEKWTMVIG